MKQPTLIKVKAFTLKERLLAGLKRLGWVEVTPSPSKRYVALEHPHTPGTFRFVGRNGALRQGPAVTRSFSLGCSDDRTHFYNCVLLLGQRTLNEKANKIRSI